MVFIKKVNNADAGTADTVGGDDWDKLDNYFDNVDITGPANIATNTNFNTDKLRVWNPARTFSYQFNSDAILADRNVTLPLLTGNDIFTFNDATQTLTNKTISGANNTISNLPNSALTADVVLKTATQTLTNKTIDEVTNTLYYHTAYKFTIFIDANDGNKYKCRNNDTGTIVSTHASDAKTVIQYAVDNAAGAPIFIKGGIYLIGSSLDLRDAYVTIHGEKSVDYDETVGQTILKKNYTATSTDVFINANGAAYWYVDLRHLVIKGDSEGIGLQYNHNIRHMYDVFIYQFRTGLIITDCVYTNIFDLVIESCVDYGMKLMSANTLYFYGGRIKSNGTNIYIEDGEVASFFGTNIEHGVTRCLELQSVGSAPQPNSMTFYGCAFESWSDTLTELIYDEGRNNTYHNCKFNTDNTTQTLVHIGANAQNIEFHSCLWKANTASTTSTITIDAGATRTKFLFNNVHSGGQITSFVFTDNGTDTLCLGNAPLPNGLTSIPIKLPNELKQARTIPVVSTECWGTATASNAPFSAQLLNSATVSSLAGEANHPGIVKAISSTSVDSGVNFNMGTSNTLLRGGEQFEAIVKFSAFTNNTVRIGFGDTATVADNVDGVYFEMAGSSTISAKTSSNSTRSTHATTYTASTGTWYHFKINVVSSSLVQFYIYSDAGAELYARTLTTNIPTGANRQCGPQVIGTNSTTTGSIDIYEVDYIAVLEGGLTPLARGAK